MPQSFKIQQKAFEASYEPDYTITGLAGKNLSFAEAYECYTDSSDQSGKLVEH